MLRKETIMHFYIYSRKSIYTGKGESIENQIELCRSYISSKYPCDPDPHIKIYEDEGFSGKNTERPQFQKMLCDIQLDPPDFIVWIASAAASAIFPLS